MANRTPIPRLTSECVTVTLPRAHADEGNRTLVPGLASQHSATEPHPLIGIAGFEPALSCSQGRRRKTKLGYIPNEGSRLLNRLS